MVSSFFRGLIGEYECEIDQYAQGQKWEAVRSEIDQQKVVQEEVVGEGWSEQSERAIRKLFRNGMMGRIGNRFRVSG